MTRRGSIAALACVLSTLSPWCYSDSASGMFCVADAAVLSAGCGLAGEALSADSPTADLDSSHTAVSAGVIYESSLSGDGSLADTESGSHSSYFSIIGSMSAQAVLEIHLAAGTGLDAGSTALDATCS